MNSGYPILIPRYCAYAQLAMAWLESTLLRRSFTVDYDDAVPGCRISIHADGDRRPEFQRLECTSEQRIRGCVLQPYGVEILRLCQSTISLSNILPRGPREY